MQAGTGWSTAALANCRATDRVVTMLRCAGDAKSRPRLCVEKHVITNGGDHLRRTLLLRPYVVHTSPRPS